jgi:hypothetical protein
MKRGNIIDVTLDSGEVWTQCEVLDFDVAQGVYHTTPSGRTQWSLPVRCTLIRETASANPVYETMTRVQVSEGRLVRVWREEPSLTLGPDREVLAAINSSAISGDIMRNVGRLERVSAIEIVDEFGNGGIFYPDWK